MAKQKMHYEYGILFSGGSILLRSNDPEVEAIYPLDKWIKSERRNGHQIVRRAVPVGLEVWQVIEP